LSFDLSIEGITTMKLSRRSLIKNATVGGAAAAVTSGVLASGANAASPLSAVPQRDGKTAFTAAQALERLKEGNRRFVADQPAQPDISSRRRMEIAKGQAPFAAILACADSRVGPEQLFGAGLGELFVVRTAGNYADAAGTGSLAFSIEELGVPLIVVLGHERCGAVKAAVAVVKDNAVLPGAIGVMVDPIVPAVVTAKNGLAAGADLVDASVRANVKRVADRLRGDSDPAIAESIKSGKLMVVGAYYDLDTGTVQFLDG
jgi:carbonic anhydrase